MNARSDDGDILRDCFISLPPWYMAMVQSRSYGDNLSIHSPTYADAFVETVFSAGCSTGDLHGFEDS